MARPLFPPVTAKGADEMVTPGPWIVGEYSDALGYDGMTGGICVGPVVLDGRDYGQDPCEPISPEALAQMQSDAHLIAAARDLLAACKQAEELIRNGGIVPIKGQTWQSLTDAIAKATQ